MSAFVENDPIGNLSLDALASNVSPSRSDSMPSVSESVANNSTSVDIEKSLLRAAATPPPGQCLESPSVLALNPAVLSRVHKASTKIFGLSPVSEIAVHLQDASLDTPKSRRVGCSKIGKVKSSGLRSLLEAGDSGGGGDQKQLLEPRREARADDDGGGGGGDSDKNIASGVEGGDVGSGDLPKSDDNSRISTTFSLNSAGRSPASHRAEQLQRSAQRRLHITPLRMDNKFMASPGKENLPSEEELSFYHGNSPQASPRPCSPCDCPEESELLASEITPNKQIIVSGLTGTGSANRQRRPLEDYDPNSMDSGYGASVSSEGHKSQSMFRFIQPSAPRQSSTSVSPAATSMRIFHSLSSGSMESMDDIDMDLFEMDTLDDDAQLPSNLNSLICGDIKAIKTTPENKRPFFRRCLSLSDNPVARRAKNNLLFESPVAASNPTVTKTPERFRIAPDQENLNLTPFSSRADATRCFKRPEPPGISPIQSKRHKTEVITPLRTFRSAENTSLDSPSFLTVQPKRPILQKSISMNDAQIMSALSRSTSEPDLIGDFSKSYILPLTEGRHRDLKSISPETMAALVRGTFGDDVASFKIIDCRYPYEFDGGHIRGAKNLYTQEQILEELIKIKTEPPKVETDGPKRNIIVFHCEFSSERGPKLSRFLRNHDRILNSDSYPALHYPEIYLLHGGYKDFFAVYPELCDPIAYRPMLDPEFGDAYRHFRAKSKSWNGDAVRSSAQAGTGSSSTSNRLVKSRSRLVL